MELLPRTSLSVACDTHASRSASATGERQCKGLGEACGSGPADYVRCLSVVVSTWPNSLYRAPIGLALFLGSMGIMEGRDRRHTQDKFRDLYAPLLKANWQIWPLAQVSSPQ